MYLKTLLKRARRLIDSSRFLELESSLESYIFSRLFYEQLIRQALTSTEKGTAGERYCDHEVIVSLTSYGRRVFDVAATIESIMQGSVKPNRIVLWLAEDEFRSKSLPVMLQRQGQRGLEVAFCKDTRSYTKLIPALKKYPDATIITADDDVMYRYDFVENLLSSHREHPAHIIAYRIHRITLKDGKPQGYLKWVRRAKVSDDLPLNFFTGVGGVLYPAHCFPDAVFDEEVFLSICPHADDVWFNAMALLKGTRTLQCNCKDPNGENYIEIPDIAETPLRRFNKAMNNSGGCENDVQLKAVFDRYGLWEKLGEN